MIIRVKEMVVIVKHKVGGLFVPKMQTKWDHQWQVGVAIEHHNSMLLERKIQYLKDLHQAKISDIVLSTKLSNLVSKIKN